MHQKISLARGEKWANHRSSLRSLLSLLGMRIRSFRIGGAGSELRDDLMVILHFLQKNNIVQGTNCACEVSLYVQI